MSPRPAADVSSSAEFAIRGSAAPTPRETRYLLDHPAPVAVLSYLALAVICTTYDIWFYREFRINILAYTGVGDFLFGPLRNPLTVFLALLPILALVAVHVLRRRSTPAGETVPPVFGLRGQKPAWRAGTFAALFVVYAAVFTNVIADRMSMRVKNGSHQRVAFARTDGPNYSERPVLLGSNAKFFFLYYPQRKVTEIVPVENTGRLTVEARSRSERSRDSAAAQELTVGSGASSPPLNP
jgi:hypothetical protein